MAISPLPRLLISLTMGSREPWTSTFKMIFSSFVSPDFTLENSSSRVIFFRGEACFLDASVRSRIIWRASFSVATVRKTSPAEGMPLRPITETGKEGPAFSTFSPRKSNMARKCPKALPATTILPVSSVPFWTSNVATGPLDLSNSASITVPITAPRALARMSVLSATKRTASSRSSMPCFCLAETGITMVLPPHSSGARSFSLSCFLTSSGLELALSTLLSATMIGTRAALA